MGGGNCPPLLLKKADDFQKEEGDLCIICCGTIFLFTFENCLWRQPNCLLGLALFVQNQFIPGLVRVGLFVWACSSYMIVRYLITITIKDHHQKQMHLVNWTYRVTRFECSVQPVVICSISETTDLWRH